MARIRMFLAAAAFLAPLPALAGVTVIGSSPARVCYEAAESPLRATTESLRACNSALESGLTPLTELVATRVNRGILYLRRGDTDRAMTDFDAAMAMNPDEPETYLNRGSALMRRESPGDAIAMFTTAISKNTRRPELAYYARAVAHENLGNIRAAYSDYRRASQLAPRWNEPRVELSRFRVVR